MIYYVRHGQTADNQIGISTGRNDIPLNSTGLSQAKQVSEALKNVQFDIAFCSPLLRAKQTLQQILHHHPNLDVVYDDRIIERDYGTLTGYHESKYTFNRWDYNGNFDAYPGLETPKMIYARAQNFYTWLRSTHPNKTILIVAHGGFGRATHCYFNGLPPNGDLAQVVIPNAKHIVYKF